MKYRILLAILVAAHAASGRSAAGQSSSLYVQDVQAVSRPQSMRAATPRDQLRERLAPALAAHSLTAVRIPEARKFAVHDLITIIVREATENDSKAKLETEKETTLEGGVSEWPDFLNILDLSAKKPKVNVEFSKEFEGDGTFKRSDTFTTRITAKIIDVKPNGLIVLEARRHMRTDKETVSMILTGTCRPQDVSGDNTVQSTVLADLQLIKEHDGELRNATKKGVVTQVLEGLFAF